MARIFVLARAAAGRSRSGTMREPAGRAPSLGVRRLVERAIDFYWGAGVCDDVPALAWFLLAALVPLALGMTAVASLALGDYAEAQAVAERAARVLPSADQHDTEATVALGGREIASRDLLLDLALAEPQHRDRVANGERSIAST